ncbi:MAG TPA: BlaI/MecI/CopY family transcriptional regulator [Bacteroidales bacterium]|jgi:predicted transcriptional regulator|nr:BlaI/MecI/CopY family transcriptional regulator [Bacteroidales bacterium]HPT10181.1 BlaI/MecI/CopY family transcriptional regulator [Bacteroidales bacterium]
MMKKEKPKPRELTRAEEQVMQALWKIEKGMVHDILDHFPEPKPAYNTVSTITRILEQKGFVGHKAYGRTHEYYPLISRVEYTRGYLSNFLQNYFGNSFHSLASFFAREEKPSLAELEEIRELINKEINHQKKRSHE